MPSKMLEAFDRVFDDLLARLGCSQDRNDAHLISHWQGDEPAGFRIQVTRKSDGKALTRFVDQTGNVYP